MRWISLVVCVGCGSVKANQQRDAAPADSPPMGCTVHTTPMSCGPTCVTCPAPGGREVATCDGTACGLACADNAPRCSDNSCAQIAWTFDDGTLDGITPRAPNGLAIGVRANGGNPALALDVTNLSEVSFTIPVCVTGNANFAAKTLTATVTFQGGTSTGDQFYVQASVPQPTNGDFLSPTVSFAANTPKQFSALMNGSSMSATTTSIVFQAGTFGQQFSGTIWFDDIKLQ